MDRIPSTLQGLPDDLLTTDNPYRRAVKVGLPLTAFGEVRTESLSPITQVTAQYSLLRNVLTVTDNEATGTNSIEDNKFTCDSGTSATGLASITTLRQLSYRAGQGALGRFTALFDVGTVGNVQVAGLITAENTFAFAYVSDAFGILHAHDGQDELQELTLTVAAGTETATATIDGTAYSVSLTGTGTVQGDAFEISQSLNAQVPNYNFTSNENQVVAQSVLPTPQGLFAYSSAGTSAGAWVQLVAGLAAVQEFTPQVQWNCDPMADLNPQMGNVYQIQFQYLGFGAINFFIESEETGELVLVHTIKYANSHTTPSVSNPTFRIGWLSTNIGNTTSVRIQGTSAGAFIEGAIFRDNAPLSDSHEQISVGTSLTNITSLRNRISFGGKVNRAELFPLIVSAASQTNKAAFFKILLNPVYATPVTFTYANKNSSIAELTSDKVLVSGGQEIGTVTVVNGAPAKVEFNKTIGAVTAVFPGSTVCLAAQMSSGAAADCQASVTWQEDL